MAIVVIESPTLSTDQKTRIGDRVIQALHLEGMAPGSIVVLFRPERGDLYLDGGLIRSEVADADPTPVATPRAIKAAPAEEVKVGARRSKPELEALKTNLLAALKGKGSLSSFEAQGVLGLKECDWAPATLRRLFTELEEAQLITKSGQKRGTRYVWGGSAEVPPPAPAVKLVKGDTEEA